RDSWRGRTETPFLRVHRRRIAAASIFARQAAGLGRLLASVAERWAASIQPDATPAAWTVISGKHGAELSVEGPGLAKLKEWKDIGPQLGTSSVLFRRGGFAQAQPSIGSPLSPRSDGFSSIPLGEGLTLFGFWRYIEGLPDDAQVPILTFMNQLVDE